MISESQQGMILFSFSFITFITFTYVCNSFKQTSHSSRSSTNNHKQVPIHSKYFNNPRLRSHLTVSIDSRSPAGKFYETMRGVINEIIPQSSSISLQDMEIAPLTGGITNQLYLVNLRPLKTKVIVRVFGEGTDEFLDRRVENVIFANLSSTGIGPKFYGLFGNGRVEGYLPSRALTPEETKRFEYIPAIARSVAQFHSQSIDGIPPDLCLWRMLDKFLSLAQEAVNSSTNEEFRNSPVLQEISVSTMRQQCDWLRDYFTNNKHKIDSKLSISSSTDWEAQGREYGYTKVFAHNDLLSGNILLLDSVSPSTTPASSTSSLVSQGTLFNGGQPALILIDFEYAGFNVRAWDIANHFCGTCFVDLLNCIVCYYFTCLTNNIEICMSICLFI